MIWIHASSKSRKEREREREREEQRRKTRIEVRMKQKLVKGEENFPNSEWSEEGNVKSSWQTCFPPFILFLPNLDSYLDLFVSLRADPRKGFVVSPDRIEGERRGRVYQRRGGVNLWIGDFNKIKVCRDNCLMFLFFPLSLSLCKDNIFRSSFAKSMRFLISQYLNFINFHIYINMGHEIGSINTSLNTLFNTYANCNAKG